MLNILLCIFVVVYEISNNIFKNNYLKVNQRINNIITKQYFNWKEHARKVLKSVNNNQLQFILCGIKRLSLLSSDIFAGIYIVHTLYSIKHAVYCWWGKMYSSGGMRCSGVFWKSTFQTYHGIEAKGTTDTQHRRIPACLYTDIVHSTEQRACSSTFGSY